MAFFYVFFFSPTLRFGTDVNVVIPTPNADELMNHKDTSYFHTGAKYQVLYLLHGSYGDYSDWMRLTSIEKYAQNHKIAVVMPSAFVVFAGFAVMAIRYYANDKMLIALIMGVLAVVTLADSAFIGLPGPNALLVVKMALVALMEAALIVNCYMAYKARKKGKHVR